MDSCRGEDMPISKNRDILKGVIGKLRSMGTGFTVSSQDVTEGFERPSFFVSLKPSKSKNHMSNALERSGDVRIVYFPTSKYYNQEEILDMQDLLRETFLENKK